MRGESALQGWIKGIWGKTMPFSLPISTPTMSSFSGPIPTLTISPGGAGVMVAHTSTCTTGQREFCLEGQRPAHPHVPRPCPQCDCMHHPTCMSPYCFFAVSLSQLGSIWDRFSFPDAVSSTSRIMLLVHDSIPHVLYLHPRYHLKPLCAGLLPPSRVPCYPKQPQLTKHQQQEDMDMGTRHGPSHLPAHLLEISPHGSCFAVSWVQMVTGLCCEPRTCAVCFCS